MTQSLFVGATLLGTSLDDAQLVQANFQDAACEGARFCGADLTYADFSRSDLRNCDFSGARLFRAVLHRIQDEGATFTDRARALETDPELAEAEMWHQNQSS